MRPQLFVLASLALCGCTPDEQAPAVGSSGAVAATADVRADDTPVATPITEIPPAIEVTGEEVTYGSLEDSNLNGYFVVPADIVEPVPGVIMVHDWWGLTDTVRAMARRLAGEGYAVLAIDLYGGRTAVTADEAEDLMLQYVSQRAPVLGNLRQAHEFLTQNALAPKIGMLGFGLGGDWSLEAGIDLGDSIDAIVVYYAQVVDDQNLLGELKAPLLGLFAAQDQTVPVREVTRFRSTMRDIGKTAQILIYPGVSHDFANPDGASYDHDTAIESWATVLNFLDGELR